jgi:hypothetical protein
MAANPLRALSGALLAAQLGACCDETVTLAELRGPNNSAYSSVWVGDTVSVSAVAVCAKGFLCYRELYDSRSYPSRFAYEVENPAIATMNAQGVIVGRQVGITMVRVTVEGITTPSPVRVDAPVVRFERTMEPAAPRAGDTITFRIRPIGPDGAEAAGANVYSVITPANDRDFASVQLLPAREATVRTVVIKSPGDYRLVTSTSHMTRDGLKELADTLRFTVSPPA